MDAMRYGIGIILICMIPSLLYGQMERKRVKISEPLDIFSTPALMAQSTVRQVAAGNLNVTIMHSFGIATRNVGQSFFGLDNVQNVRLGLDFGITDRWSAGIGRSSFLNVIDLRSKYALLRQKPNNSIPLSFSLKGDLGIVTRENGLPFEDDLSTIFSAHLARKFNEHVSLQLSPSYSHFNTVNSGNYHNHFAIGIGSEVTLSDRYSLITEYIPVLGNRNPGTTNAFTLGMNIETGGHVFQLYFSSTYWHLDQYVMAQNRDQFWNGDFRFGFNVNRIFGL